MTQTWEQAMYARIARAVRSARKESGRSAQDIADATAEMGYPISRSRIANLENGRKQGVDVAELMVLAAALSVPPVTLLYPGSPDHEIEMLPGRSRTSVFALGWFAGDTILAKDAVAQPDSTRATMLRLTRERAGAQRALEAVEALARDYTAAGDDEAAGRAMMQAAEINQRIGGYDATIFLTSDDHQEDEE